MSAKSTGANPTPNGNSAHRTHNDGSAERAFTIEQKEAVIRVRKCKVTDFYDILNLESEKTTITDAGIKKAYRKLSLLTHPDKNGYKGADEAFKMVSRAFQILSDPEKKKRYDQFGGDPDNRFSSSSASASNPFANGSPFPGFAARPGARGQMFEEEISPEELFRQFFGGGAAFGGRGFGGGGLFDSSPGFVFNLGGGPGVRVHQFGGNRPRRRPPGANDQGQPAQGSSPLFNLLPLLIFFILPLLSSLFSGFDVSGAPKVPAFNLDVPAPPHLTYQHNSARLGIPYYINPTEVSGLSNRKWQELDRAAENKLVTRLNAQCEREYNERERLMREAQGWFSIDQEKMDEADRLEMRGCERLRRLRGGR